MVRRRLPLQLIDAIEVREALLMAIERGLYAVSYLHVPESCGPRASVAGSIVCFM